MGEETEIERFLAGLDELLASNPGLIMSEDGIKIISGAVIGRWMPDGLFLLPTETLNELRKIGAFSQQPTIDSITQGLYERGLLILGEDKHLKRKVRMNGGRPRGWYLKIGLGATKLQGGPIKSPEGPRPQTPSGAAKNASCGLGGPSGPTGPSEKEREKFSEDFMNNHYKSQGGNVKHKSGGASGATGAIDSIDRLIDIGFDVNVGGPTSGPTKELSGPTPTPDAAEDGPKDGPEVLNYEQAVHDGFVALVRFNTDYATDWPRDDGRREMVSYAAGDECVAPLDRAWAWQQRRTASILWIDATLAEAEA